MTMPTLNTFIFAPLATLPGNLLDKIEIENEIINLEI